MGSQAQSTRCHARLIATTDAYSAMCTCVCAWHEYMHIRSASHWCSGCELHGEVRAAFHAFGTRVRHSGAARMVGGCNICAIQLTIRGWLHSPTGPARCLSCCAGTASSVGTCLLLRRRRLVRARAQAPPRRRRRRHPRCRRPPACP